MVDIKEILTDDKEETKWEKFKYDLEYYLWITPKSWYYDIKLGIKSLVRRLPYIWKQRDWDYGYVLEAEMNELIILRDGLKKYHNHVNWERDIETLTVAIKLLTEINEGSYNDEKVLKTNLRNCKRFHKHPDHIIKLMNKTDTPEDISSGYTHCRMAKSLIREEKLWSLYHKYRDQYMRSWWD